jgi:hypothetical protein
MLLRPDHPALKLVIADGSNEPITAAMALVMLKSERYAWNARSNRVRSLRPMKPAPKWRRCYRTSEAPTLQPSIEFLLRT